MLITSGGQRLQNGKVVYDHLQFFKLLFGLIFRVPVVQQDLLVQQGQRQVKPFTLRHQYSKIFLILFLISVYYFCSGGMGGEEQGMGKWGICYPLFLPFVKPVISCMIILLPNCMFTVYFKSFETWNTLYRNKCQPHLLLFLFREKWELLDRLVHLE